MGRICSVEMEEFWQVVLEADLHDEEGTNKDPAAGREHMH